MIFGLITFITMLMALKVLPMSFCGLMINTAPFWSALIGYFLLQDELSKVEIACMVGSFVGVAVLISSTPGDSSGVKVTQLAYLAGIIAIFLCALSYSVVGILTRMMTTINFAVI